MAGHQLRSGVKVLKKKGVHHASCSSAGMKGRMENAKGKERRFGGRSFEVERKGLSLHQKRGGWHPKKKKRNEVVGLGGETAKHFNLHPTDFTGQICSKEGQDVRRGGNAEKNVV